MILDHTADFACCDTMLGYRSVICLTLCLSVIALWSNGRRYRRNFFRIRQQIPKIVLKFGLHWSPFPTQILPQCDPPLVDLSTGDI